MLTVEITPRAALHIESAARWWAENRLAAPDAIRIKSVSRAVPRVLPGRGGQAPGRGVLACESRKRPGALRQLELRITAAALEVLYASQRVASHRQRRSKWGFGQSR